MQMVDFLNKFAQSCESRLFLCDQKMRKLEDELLLLEAKLNSVPEVRDVTVPDSTSVRSPDVLSSITSSETKELAVSQLFYIPKIKEPPSVEENVPAISSNENTSVDISKYTKMVQFGVPLQAVKLKMQQEGFDPNLLDS
ncbi:hypothetical protein AAG570_006862 [Ranatra chinensis]|uniref:Uncharacterized protein n=1 Tax=Ranatra chinensis TaxID=642074 RepID=A0ABD0YVI8_9HEMI